jgi:site-specific DNA-methyltransferase (adenine-specific)
MKTNTVIFSDNLEHLRTMPDNSVDAIVTDSPYGLGKEPYVIRMLQAWITTGYLEVSGKGFMGKKWDSFVPQPLFWKECFRVLKPGGYCLSFFGTRTYDWGVMAMRLGGFEIQDCIMWIYGSGFPKGKSCLKPAYEPIALARKPGKVFRLNIDECRTQYRDGADFISATSPRPNSAIHNIERTKYSDIADKIKYKTTRGALKGRWPANIIFDEDAAQVLDEMTGVLKSGKVNGASVGTRTDSVALGRYANNYINPDTVYGDSGGASRFFYCAKASKSERAGRKHPTIKPLALMEYLIKLVCPKGGICLDPHGGSGTTGGACLNVGVDFILIDNDQDSVNESREFLKLWEIFPEKNLL